MARDLGLVLIQGEAGGSAGLGVYLLTRHRELPRRYGSGAGAGGGSDVREALPAGAGALRAGAARRPGDEQALAGQGLAAESVGRRDAALDARRRAAALNPHHGVYRARLVPLLEPAGADLAQVGPHAEAWLKLQPFNREARRSWVRHLVRAGCHAEARVELDRRLVLFPENHRDIEAWFDRLPR